MKQNKWILPAVCFCATFLAGFITGMSFSGQKQKKADAIQTLEDINEETVGTMEEEVHDE